MNGFKEFGFIAKSRKNKYDFSENSFHDNVFLENSAVQSQARNLQDIDTPEV